MEIGLAGDEVENFAGVMAHHETVDGEIAALHILFGAGGEDDALGVAAVGGADVGAECRDFNFVITEGDKDDAELCPDGH